MVNCQIDQIEKKAKENLKCRSSSNFIQLNYDTFENVLKTQECMRLYLYMVRWSTRELSRNGKSRFWNEKVFPYGAQGYIPFARHQEFIAKDLGVDQTTVSKQLKKLREMGAIKIIGSEMFPNKDKPISVYAVGVWEKVENKRVERLFACFL